LSFLRPTGDGSGIVLEKERFWTKPE